MSDPFNALLKKFPADAASGDDAAEPRIRDADGQQLVQLHNALHDELEWLEESAAKAPADLGLESTERMRGRRARTRNKR